MTKLEEIEAAVRPIPGVIGLYTQPMVLIDQIAVSPKRERMAAAGFDAILVGEALVRSDDPAALLRALASPRVAARATGRGR